MPDRILGLPLHPLIDHATAVLVPLAALLVILAVASRRFRAWAGVLPPAASLVALILTPLSTASGESLEEQVGKSPLVERHAELGEQLLPLTIALFVLSTAFWWLDRRCQRLQPEVAAVQHGLHSARGNVTTLTDAPAAVSVSAETVRRLRMATAVVGVLAILAAIGTGVQVGRIGHSGAKAAWSDAAAAIG
jgi:hypothetical protein